MNFSDIFCVRPCQSEVGSCWLWVFIWKIRKFSYWRTRGREFPDVWCFWWWPMTYKTKRLQTIILAHSKTTAASVVSFYFQFMGDFVNAIRDYQAAIKTDPSYALAYYNAANMYFRQRQFKQVSWVWLFTMKRCRLWLTLRDWKAATELFASDFQRTYPDFCM